jgi:hypothetical protein
MTPTAQPKYRGLVTAQPDSSSEQPYETIHLGGETAAIVPLAELRRLRTLERHASPEALEEAEIEATLAGYREWVAAGRPGAVSHEEAMAELLRTVRENRMVTDSESIGPTLPA